MAPWWNSQPLDQEQAKHGSLKALDVEPARSRLSHRSKRFWIILCAVLLALGAALGIGIGIGLTRGSNTSSGSESTPPPPPANTSLPIPGSIWRPPAGATWQIVLSSSLSLTSNLPNVSTYDIDLFTNPTSTITTLHSQNAHVICYFSAGSFEDFRPDASQFHTSDYAKPLDGWPGEYWLNTSSPNVRAIMTSRLQLAASKGCDGVDPDNVDGYSFDTGFDLTEESAIDYLTFLAQGAHGLNMSIGLKNAAEIVNQTISLWQWAVNEQCLQYQECDVFQPFIDAGKPVFHIEYPSEAPDVSASVKKGICGDPSTRGFSTILKDMDLDDWVDAC